MSLKWDSSSVIVEIKTCAIKHSENMSSIVDVHKYLYVLFTIMTFILVSYMLLSIWLICVSFTSLHTWWGLGGQVTASGPRSWSGLIAEWPLWSGWSHLPPGSFGWVWHRRQTVDFDMETRERWRSNSVVVLKDEPSYLKPNSVLSVN